jgi:hypothetical protein
LLGFGEAARHYTYIIATVREGLLYLTSALSTIPGGILAGAIPFATVVSMFVVKSPSYFKRSLSSYYA